MITEYFKGSEMSALNADKFAMEFIEPHVLAEDEVLMDKKYWDYKMLHPAVATMYFVHRYYEIAATILDREQGVAAGRKMRAVASKYDLRKQNTAVVRAFWKARMAADAIGCHYDVYIRAAIRQFRDNHKTFASVKATGGRQALPYPQQLALDSMITRAILDWTARKQVTFPMPQHPGIPHNRDLWFRPEMEAWLREEAGKTQYKDHYIKKATDAGLILGPA